MHPNAEAHRAAGRTVTTRCGEIFVREDGDGPSVLLLHGVPTSSYLYRKIVPLLAANGCHAVAPDLPGLGLSAKPDPREYDYGFSGLADAMEALVDALGIDRYHLVVHDLGGPVGFDLALRDPGRVAGLVVLDTWLDLDQYRPPRLMQTFRLPVVDRLAVAALQPLAAYPVFLRLGVADRTQFGIGDMAAYLDLLRHGDGGQAFLSIMRRFETDPARRRELEEGLARAPFGSSVVWGRHDPVLGAARASHLATVLACGEPVFLDARHLLQEDQAPAISEAILRRCHDDP